MFEVVDKNKSLFDLRGSSRAMLQQKALTLAPTLHRHTTYIRRHSQLSALILFCGNYKVYRFRCGLGSIPILRAVIKPVSTLNYTRIQSSIKKAFDMNICPVN